VNEYRKEGGKWKISSLHWYETFTVPYQGGWKGAMTQTNVADRRLPPPDRPTTFRYDVWPAVYLPPAGFAHPVREARHWLPPRPRSRTAVRTPTRAQLARLQQIVTQLEDERDIEILQRTYGYYVDKNLWSQIATDVHRGRHAGDRRTRRVRRPAARAAVPEWLGNPVHGRLYDHTDAARHPCVA
jgi:hypothetical protein